MFIVYDKAMCHAKHDGHIGIGPGTVPFCLQEVSTVILQRANINELDTSVPGRLHVVSLYVLSGATITDLGIFQGQATKGQQ